MDTELFRAIITGAPNFVGLILGLILLYKRLGQQDKLISLLISKWSDCEEDEETARLTGIRDTRS